MSADHGI